MSYTVKKLDHEPIIHYKLGADYSIVAESAAAEAEVIALVAAQVEPVYVIFDFSQVKLGLEDVVQGSNMLVSGVGAKRHAGEKTQGIFDQPNMRQMIMVTDSRLIQMAAKGMNSPIFGNQNIVVCATPEEALAYARSQVGQYQ